jgi:hypothetical protein
VFIIGSFLGDTFREGFREVRFVLNADVFDLLIYGFDMIVDLALIF